MRIPEPKGGNEGGDGLLASNGGVWRNERGRGLVAVEAMPPRVARMQEINGGFESLRIGSSSQVAGQASYRE